MSSLTAAQAALNFLPKHPSEIRYTFFGSIDFLEDAICLLNVFYALVASLRYLVCKVVIVG